MPGPIASEATLSSKCAGERKRTPSSFERLRASEATPFFERLRASEATPFFERLRASEATPFFERLWPGMTVERLVQAKWKTL